jgi:LCCL domain/Bacterial Ig-like domain (group 2)
VTITPTTASLAIGAIQQFTAQALDASGAVVPNKTFVFSSSDTGVATMNSSDLASAVSAGTSTITATLQDSNLKATASITVLAAATEAEWNTLIIQFRGQNGTQFRYTCPAKGDVSFSVVWGTDVYTDDSPICVAAVHAGKITVAGGTITIEIRAGQASYTGSTRNDVITFDYGSWGGSYVFVN